MLNEDKENAINGKQKDSVREETSVVSSTMKVSVQNRDQKTAPSSEPRPQRGRSASRKGTLRRRSSSEKSNRQQRKDFLNGTCTKLSCDDFASFRMSIFQSLNRVANSAQSAPFLTGRLRNNQWQYCKMCDRWVVYCKTQSRQNLHRFFGRAQKSRHADTRENTGPSLGKIQVRNSHQRSPFAVKCEDRSQDETERQE